MKPLKHSGAPRFLAAGHDSLFMAPGSGCTMLQWAEARTNLVVSRRS